MADVVCIYTEDSLDWKEYLNQRLTSREQDIKTDSVLLSDIQTKTHLLKGTKCVVVIASPNCLEHLINTEDCDFSCLAEQADRCVLLLLGVNEDEIKDPEVNLCSRFPRYDTWKKISHEAPDELLIAVVSIVDKYIEDKAKASEKKKKIPPPTPSKPTAGLKPNPPKSSQPNAPGEKKTKPIPANRQKAPAPASFDFSLNEVRCESKTQVTIFLEEAIPEEKHLTVVLTGSDGNVIGIQKARRRNPYSYTFVTPVHPEDTVSASVMVHTDDPSSQKSLGKRQLKYVSQSEEIWDLMQLPLSLLNSTCRMLKYLNTSAPEMDAALSKTMDETMEVLPLKTLEQLFGIHLFCNKETSKHLTPTLLHLASLYGLQELSMKLMDLPDSAYAYSINNSEHKQPAAMASGAGHPELATYLSSHQEVNDQMDDIYMAMMAPLYDKCRKEGIPHYDSPFRVPIRSDGSIYLDMSGSDQPGQPGKPRVTDSIYMDMAEATEPAGTPEDDYEPMAGIQRPQDPKRRSKSESCIRNRGGFVQVEDSFLEEEEDEELDQYMEIEAFFKGAGATIPDPMLATLETPAKTADMSKSQRDLVDILTQAKNQDISISDAERMFSEWKLQHQSSNSFKEKQEGLEKMRQDLQIVNRPQPEAKRKPFVLRKMMTSVFGKSEPKKPSKGSDTRSFQPSIPEDGIVETDGSSPRNSSASTYSSDRGSTLSTDSAYETDGHLMDDTGQAHSGAQRRHHPARARSVSQRHSLRDQFEEELNNPSASAPPVPPRLPRQHPFPRATPSAEQALRNKLASRPAEALPRKAAPPPPGTR